MWTKGDRFRLRWPKNGNAYAIPPDEAARVAEGAKNWSGWFVIDEFESLLPSDTYAPFYYRYTDSLSKSGVGRLRLHKPDEMPKKTELM
jgi:hypothetical protein